MKQNSLWLLAGLLIGCAQTGPGHRPTSNKAPVDAVLPAGRNLFLFDFAQSRYQRWNLEDTCGLADTLRGNWAKSSNWLTLATPGSSFAPVTAAPGPNGHFFILDRIGRRLCLYDTNAQFLSAFPLPQELKDRNPERLEVHWTRDGIFSFLDLSEGTAWQYMEVRSQRNSSGGQGDWRLVNRIRLPLSLESCLWEPFFRNPCCLMKSAKRRPVAEAPGRPDPAAAPASMTCFDRYFNPQGATPSSVDSVSGAARLAAEPGQGIRALPDGPGTGWSLVLEPPACGDAGSQVPYCFHPDRGTLVPCSHPPGAPDRAVP